MYIVHHWIERDRERTGGVSRNLDAQLKKKKTVKSSVRRTLRHPPPGDLRPKHGVVLSLAKKVSLSSMRGAASQIIRRGRRTIRRLRALPGEGGGGGWDKCLHRVNAVKRN